MEKHNPRYDLVQFSPRDVHRVWRFLQEVPAEENGFVNPEAGIDLDEFLGRVTPEWEAQSRGEDVAVGGVAQTNFFLWENYDSPAKKVVARFKLRHELNSPVERAGGHIGYFVHRDYRGRGLGELGLKLLLPIAARLVVEDELLATMEPDNVASQRLFAACGGVVIDPVQQVVEAPPTRVDAVGLDGAGAACEVLRPDMVHMAIDLAPWRTGDSARAIAELENLLKRSGPASDFV